MGGILRYDEPMTEHTSWAAGGPARRFFVPADLADLCEFLRRLDSDEPVFWLGLGSNLLVRDAGYKGTVIQTHGVLDDIEIEGNSIRVGAGVTCAKVARLSVRKGLVGAEFLAGIPGTMGGALAMNAGAFEGETWDIVEEVQLVKRDGSLINRKAEEFDIAYRNVNVSKDEWFIAANLKLRESKQSDAGKNIKSLLAKRAESQPLGERSCGSVFQNPPDDYAARLIEECGLKGRCVGDAEISQKHANFIINRGSATASDIESLIELAREAVLNKFHIELKTEVRIIGDEG